MRNVRLTPTQLCEHIAVGPVSHRFRRKKNVLSCRWTALKFALLGGRVISTLDSNRTACEQIFKENYLAIQVFDPRTPKSS